MRFPGLSTDLLRHHPKELVGCLDRGIVEPGDVAAGRHRVLCVALLLHILHQLLQYQEVRTGIRKIQYWTKRFPPNL